MPARIVDLKYHVIVAALWVMYNVVTNQQPGLGTSLDSLGCLSSTSKTSKPKNTGSMKQLGQARRQKSSHGAEPGETPSAGSGGVVHNKAAQFAAIA
ncbi:putative transposase [Scytonema sp. HK-05]|nr:putative transposase [Scytonema sp. HK-05]